MAKSRWQAKRYELPCSAVAHGKGHIGLAAPLRRNGNGKQYKHRTMLNDKQPLLNLSAGKIQDISLI
ncbi:MAG: hypothetical protein HS132_10410 [Planctomycetia bacterium]|nr:hypothetical protein [Planctomycetia bacterium]